MGGKEKKKPSRITEADEAVLKLKKQRDELKKYRKRVNAVIENDRLLAKKLLEEGKKDRARLLLRKKKHQETLLERTDKQLDNLEQLTHDIEFAQVERQVLDGLKSGNEALKAANRMFSIEEIESIMDDTAEAEEAALAELDQIIADADKVAEIPEEELVPQLPDVPSDKIPEAKKEKAKKVGKVALEAS